MHGGDSGAKASGGGGGGGGGTGEVHHEEEKERLPQSGARQSAERRRRRRLEEAFLVKGSIHDPAIHKTLGDLEELVEEGHCSGGPEGDEKDVVE